MPSHLSNASRASTLSVIPEGTQAHIVRINAGIGIQMRLAAMRILPNSKIKMIRNMGRGPIVVSSRGNRIALGRGLAHKIFVASV